MVNAKAEKTLATNYWDKDKDKDKKTKTKTNDECPGGADFRDQLGKLDEEDKEDEEYDEDDVYRMM